MVTALVDWRGEGQVSISTKWTFEAPEGALKDLKTAKVARVLISKKLLENHDAMIIGSLLATVGLQSHYHYNF